MKMLLAIILPPLAVLLCGKPIQALLNIVLCVVTLWLGAAIHAIYTVTQSDANRRHRETLKAHRSAMLSNG